MTSKCRWMPHIPRTAKPTNVSNPPKHKMSAYRKTILSYYRSDLSRDTLIVTESSAGGRFPHNGLIGSISRCDSLSDLWHSMKLRRPILSVQKEGEIQSLKTIYSALKFVQCFVGVVMRFHYIKSVLPFAVSKVTFVSNLNSPKWWCKCFYFHSHFVNEIHFFRHLYFLSFVTRMPRICYSAKLADTVYVLSRLEVFVQFKFKYLSPFAEFSYGR